MTILDHLLHHVTNLQIACESYGMRGYAAHVTQLLGGLNHASESEEF